MPLQADVGIIELVASLVTLLGMVAIMLLLNVWLALGTLVVMPLMLVFTLRMGRGTRRGFQQVQGNLGRLNAVMEESISGMRVVQAFVREYGEEQRFRTVSTTELNASLRADKLASIFMPGIDIISQIGVAIVLGFGGARVLAVATGGHSMDELRRHQPDWLVRDLREVSAREICGVPAGSHAA